jgi:hypothetical protein
LQAASGIASPRFTPAAPAGRWKYELQQLADKLDISIHVSHFPPGTRKM